MEPRTLIAIVMAAIVVIGTVLLSGAFKDLKSTSLNGDPWNGDEDKDEEENQ